MSSITDTSLFTENEIIDAIEMKDSSVEMTGYVDNIFATTKAANNANVCRLTINNGQGRRVQLIAWAGLTTKLEKFAELHSVLSIERAYSKPVIPNSKFNDGNARFELVLNDNTTIEVLGTYQLKPTRNPTTTLVTFDDIINVMGKCRIEGYIKNNINLLKTNKIVRGIGSITNGEKKLEIQVTQYEDHFYQKGQYVEVTGELCPRTNSSPYLRVTNMSDIKLLEKPKASMELLLRGYKYVD